MGKLSSPKRKGRAHPAGSEAGKGTLGLPEVSPRALATPTPTVGYLLVCETNPHPRSFFGQEACLGLEQGSPHHLCCGERICTYSEEDLSSARATVFCFRFASLTFKPLWHLEHLHNFFPEIKSNRSSKPVAFENTPLWVQGWGDREPEQSGGGICPSDVTLPGKQMM